MDDSTTGSEPTAPSPPAAPPPAPSVGAADAPPADATSAPRAPEPASTGVQDATAATSTLDAGGPSEDDERPRDGGTRPQRPRRRGSRGGRRRKSSGDGEQDRARRPEADPSDDSSDDAARDTARGAIGRDDVAIDDAGRDDVDRADVDRDDVDRDDDAGDENGGDRARGRRRGHAGVSGPSDTSGSGAPGAPGAPGASGSSGSSGEAGGSGGSRQRRTRQPKQPGTPPVMVPSAAQAVQPELPERPNEGRISDATVAEQTLVPRAPRIGDTRPAPPAPPSAKPPSSARPPARQSRGGKPSAGEGREDATPPSTEKKKRRRPERQKRGTKSAGPSTAPTTEIIERRRGKERNGRPLGRYLMCVQVREEITQVGVLEGLSLIEHYVSRPADDVGQIHGNIYLGRVQNVLPGMEAAFVDIATPKNAVLYRGDVQYDAEDIVEGGEPPKIEEMLRSRQMILSQVTKNPIGAKGARLTQEVSLPGRFVVLIPNSKTYGISKRLPDDERKRLRGILDRVKPAEHGLIVRTAAESATEHELQADVRRLAETWADIASRAEQARKANQPRLLYREPELAVRVIREEFNADYRGVVIDDRRLYEEVKSYVEVMNPELADRIEFYDAEEEGLPIFERFHIHEQLHKALDRKVWLPSGGSLIIEHTEALTVIDVNTGKNVGTSNLEATVFHNNLEAAEEIARQLRLRDIGGIIVIDFIDMEIRENRRKVVDAFRSALARDKTRTQVFDISELGLVEMTRKRIGEGLLTNFTDTCPNCEGRGVLVDHSMLD